MMEREVGNRHFPLWLIGDSNPPQWQSFLKTPLDPRHPIRHNIWTALLDVIQDKVYRASRMRVDTSTIYIRNAVDDPTKKPAQTSNQWSKSAETEISGLESLIKTHKPIMLFCFGAFTYEFVRRAIGEQERRKYGYWGARRLGDEFRYRIGKFDPNKTNIIPLLHRSISGGKFIESHKYFCGEEGVNYFEFVGGKIADKMLQYSDQLHIWIE
ncbi:MAG: hypothetical protein MUO30_06760 [Anaerolineales bacterium]|nr:hypothetical protein [Anaerolineales bacterium]